MDEVTRRLVAYTVGVTPAGISERTRAEVGRRLVDSLGCALAALDSEPVTALRRMAAARPQPGGCTVWGSDIRTAPELAALVNATAVRFLDYSDYTVGGHPSDNLAAIVAAAEWADRSVDDLVAGALVSYEVFGELGRLLIRYRGWDQGTTAVIAAVCGIGKVLGLSADQLTSAIGMVATGNIATGQARRGALTMWKGVAGPYAASSALIAAEMAAVNVTGPSEAFAGEFGFFAQISGPFEIERLDPSEEPFYIFRTATKQWPVQFDLQPAVFLGRQIRDAVPIDQITSIEIEASEWTWKGTANDGAKWAPSTRETADHSLPFILAVATHRGAIEEHDFRPDSIADDQYRRLMARVTVQPAADITAETLEYCWMRASVTLADGTRHDLETKEPRSKPASDEDLIVKWRQLAGRSRFAERADELYAAFTELRGDRPARELARSVGAR